jgi:hypothetical protein
VAAVQACRALPAAGAVCHGVGRHVAAWSAPGHAAAGRLRAAARVAAAAGARRDVDALRAGRRGRRRGLRAGPWHAGQEHAGQVSGVRACRHSRASGTRARAFQQPCPSCARRTANATAGHTRAVTTHAVRVDAAPPDAVLARRAPRHDAAARLERARQRVPPARVHTHTHRRDMQPPSRGLRRSSSACLRVDARRRTASLQRQSNPSQPSLSARATHPNLKCPGSTSTIW